MSLNLHSERRQFVRVAFDDPVQAEGVPQPMPVHSWHLLAEDLSESGLRLLSPKCFPVQSHLLIEFDSEHAAEPIRGVGRVVWVRQLPEQEEWHIGVEFTDLSERCRMQLHERVTEQRASG